MSKICCFTGSRNLEGLDIRELTQKLNDTLEDLIENGGYNPTIELCIKLCRELGVTLNDIFWRD